MFRISFQYQVFHCYTTETILECLMRNGVSVPNACRSGLCQSCLIRATSGNIPASAQEGISDLLKAKNCFLACRCVPEGDLDIALPDRNVLKRTVAVLVTKEPIGQNYLKLELQRWMPFAFRPGQYLNLFRRFELIRSYAIVGPTTDDRTIELHIRRIDDGPMTSWIFDELEIGDTIEMGEPTGDCYYRGNDPDKNLLLIGSDAGLASLWGITQDAIAQGHKGTIHLYHGGKSVDDLYLVEKLNDLAGKHANVRYTPCITGGGDIPDGFSGGDPVVAALEEYGKFDGWCAFICGHPEMVNETRKGILHAGVKMKEIYETSYYPGESQREADV